VKTQHAYDAINQRNHHFGLVHFGAHEAWNYKEREIYHWKDYALIDPMTGKNLSILGTLHRMVTDAVDSQSASVGRCLAC
jgi:hypothetical protein